jgi:serine/threonine-protein kinase RsbT
VRAIFADKGQGIQDIEAAMKDGFTTGKSLGLGLPGARRLVSEFDIQSKPGKGTTVTILKWKNGQ